MAKTKINRRGLCCNRRGLKFTEGENRKGVVGVVGVASDYREY